MQRNEISRRGLLIAALAPASVLAAPKTLVSVVRIRNERVERAVEEAIELLGGMQGITRGKDRVMLKRSSSTPPACNDKYRDCALCWSSPGADSLARVVRCEAQLLTAPM